MHTTAPSRPVKCGSAADVRQQQWPWPRRRFSTRRRSTLLKIGQVQRTAYRLCTPGRAVTRVPHPAASADKLLQGLLAVFTEKQLQRALAIVDQVCARVRSAAVDRGNASRFAHRARGQTL